MRSIHFVLLSVLLLIASVSNAQEFTFKDTKGQTQRLSDYRGKWVLVNFWATWCPPCLQEIPDLMALHKAHKDKDLVVIGVALDSTSKSVEKFAAKHKIDYPLVVGSYEMAAQIAQIEDLPTTYLFDPQGKAVSFQVGMVTREDIENYINRKSKQHKN
jgi:peroxiredoxin